MRLPGEFSRIRMKERLRAPEILRLDSLLKKLATEYADYKRLVAGYYEPRINLSHAV